MKQRKTVVRVVALLLALLMGLSVFAIVFQILAHGADTTTMETIAQTGSDNGPRMAIILAIGAVVVVGICLVIPAFLKKK